MGRAAVGPAQNHSTAHKRARRVLPLVCAYEDETCKGILHACLRHDAPEDLIRTTEDGQRYCIAEDPLVGYIRLCHSHHRRYDDPDGEKSRRGALKMLELYGPPTISHEQRVQNGKKTVAKLRERGYFGSEEHRANAGKGAAPIFCGTQAGYARHRRRGEAQCQSCKDAHAAYARHQKMTRAGQTGRSSGRVLK